MHIANRSQIVWISCAVFMSLACLRGAPAQDIKGVVKVAVLADRSKAFLAPRALGVSWDMAGNELQEPLMPQILASSGATTLRYPGSLSADTYHWSTNTTTGPGGMADSVNDFGSFAKLLDRFGTAVVTVNYGSNLDGTAGGSPEEAAAWVAYAMGDPSNNKEIGKDASGHDWRTVGYWASLRASQPIVADDGLNFLRIAHPAPVLIKYWEIGNEVYKNGFYDGKGGEYDSHVPYAKDAKENERQRKGNPALSPEAYGRMFLEFVKSMKAVDTRIRIGASLDIPLATDWNTSADWVQDPISGKWFQKGTAEAAGLGSVQKGFDAGVEWDRNVLKVIGRQVDFVSLHWYAGEATEASHYKDLDSGRTLMKLQQEPRTVLAAIEELIQQYCGRNAQNIQVLVTEMGIKQYLNIPEKTVTALFAADAYVTLVEYGIANIDWGSLHGDFLADENKPGPVYFASQLVRRLADLNDQMVTAVSSNALLSVHAAVHRDGSLGIMLINKDPKNSALAKVSVSGAKLATAGSRYDFGKNNPAKDYMVPAIAASNLGSEFTISVPSYTVTVLVIPKAQ